MIGAEMPESNRPSPSPSSIRRVLKMAPSPPHLSPRLNLHPMPYRTTIPLGSTRTHNTTPRTQSFPGPLFGEAIPKVVSAPLQG